MKDMETGSQHNTGDNKPMAAKQEDQNEKKVWLSKEAKISIVVTLITTLVSIVITLVLSFHNPSEKVDKVFRRNQKDGANQIAVWQLPPVHSFLEHLKSIEKKDSVHMWNEISDYRRGKLKSASGMMYDYCLTKQYHVEYIIPIKEESRPPQSGGKNEHVFSFYALLGFEDDVLLKGEVDELKRFHDTKLEELCNPDGFMASFNEVLDEVYEYLDRRFVIDSAEYVKNKLRQYMMNMTMEEYITRDWRFPVLFAKDFKLPRKKPEEITSISTNEPSCQNHIMLSKVVMVEDSVWKVSEFHTVALSRWKLDEYE